ncbi:MAG: glycosyltransferase family 4 protein [Nonlabens sp.]
MERKLLVIGKNWPEPESTAAGTRLLQLIELFDLDGFEINFVTDAQQGKYSYQFENAVKTHDIKLNDSSFDELLLKIKPSVVLYDRFMTEEKYGWRVRENLDKVLEILDTEDLHFLRNARKEQLLTSKSFHHIVENSPVTYREIASMERCNFSLIISEEEQAFLVSKFKIDIDKLFYLPFLNRETAIDDNPGFDQRVDFFSIGNFKHDPNLDLVVQLKEHYWPLLSNALPEAHLHIYGAYAPQHIIEMNNTKERFHVHGHAKDLDAVFRKHRVLLSPLRYGAGLKGKIFDSMRYGTPAAMTTIAAEGMYGNYDPNGVVTDDTADFVSRTVQLYRNPEWWQEAQDFGYEVLEKRFGYSAFAKALSLKISLHDTDSKEDSFKVRMLNYHSNNSCRFMSKFIEAKNKASK